MQHFWFPPLFLGYTVPTFLAGAVLFLVRMVEVLESEDDCRREALRTFVVTAVVAFLWPLLLLGGAAWLACWGLGWLIEKAVHAWR